MSRFVLCACCALVGAPVSAAVVTYDFQTTNILPAGLIVEDGIGPKGSPESPYIGIFNDAHTSPFVSLRFDFGRSVTLLAARYYGDGGDSLFSGFYCDSPPPNHGYHENGDFWFGGINVGSDFYADIEYGCFSANGSGELSVSTHQYDDLQEAYGTAALVSLTLDIAEGLAGDTNADGIVDIADLNNVRNNFGGEGLGDTNGDDLVDIEDLNSVRNNFGNSLASVPEPSSLALLSVFMLARALHTWRTMRPR